MRFSKPGKLLNDVFREGDYQKFREDLAASALAEFRQAHPKQRQQFAKWFLPLAAMVVFALFLKWSLKPDPQPLAQTEPFSPALPKEDKVAMVQTAPLRVEQWVQPAGTVSEVVTKPLPDGLVVESFSKNLVIVSTPPGLRVPSLNDSELLAMFPSQPIFLAEVAPGRKVFWLLEQSREGDSQ
ncbi:MAG: hypothetical protein ACO1QB_03295 [Verrucomicrobiales bacterium]